MNQPLNVVKIRMRLFWAKKLKSGQEISREDLKQVTAELCASVDRASRIINHLRQFGRKSDQVMTPTNINLPVRNVFRLVGSQLEARGIEWQLDLGEGLPHISGDANRLEQVFINLVLNARDAMLEQEKKSSGKIAKKIIKIRTFLENDRVVVVISDTGPGIPESIRDKIFEPFFTTKRPGEGTGLGLSISYGIIKEHDGTIELDPDGSQGAVFRISFPVLKAEINR